MRVFLFLLLAVAAGLHAQDADQRKRMIFSTLNSGEPAASPTPAPASKPADPAAVISAFFLTLKSGQVEAAYESLVKGTIIAERKENVNSLMESTKKALDSYGPVKGYEVIDSLAVGSALLRLTCISLNEDLPLRWRFYFYKSEGSWRIVDMRVDDGLVELFEEAGRRQKTPQ